MSVGLIDQVFNYLADDASGTGYVKYPNGTMICYGTYSSQNTWGNVIDFAQTFTAAPIVIPSVICNVQNAIGFTVLTVTTTTFTLSYNTTAGAKTIYWIAIGKWK